MKMVGNATHLIPSIEYLAEVFKTRLDLHFGRKSKYSSVEQVPPPNLNGQASPFTHFLSHYQLTWQEQLVLLITLAPHIQADFYDRLIAEVIPNAGDFPQLGGVRGKQHRGFLPTGETALFILAGENLSRRFELLQLFNQEHLFAQAQILTLEEPPDGEPPLSGKLLLNPEYVDLFTLGWISPPRFSMHFPAERIQTEMEWEDLVLNALTLRQVHELEAWVKHGDTILYEWGMKKRIKPGYRALFYGPPGTGKTLTASLLGKYTQKEVYKVDLSMVVSKFIGETEKNLSKLFSKAENKNWILFFDEADSLFSKRTGVRDAHDKYANQEVSYLLQRLEGFNGLVILASNLKSNIDEAFMRRFQAVIHFPMPRPEERRRLWELAFPKEIELSKEVNLAAIAQKYELSGASIMNVVQYCCLNALARESLIINRVDLVDGIKREFAKEGKVV